MQYDLTRFIIAHKEYYNTALTEIKNGKKISHWMWFIFPQIKFLGDSFSSNFYAIDSIVEAKEFLENKYLSQNLINICKELLKLKTNNVEDIFDYPDNLKLKSCMTLFDAATDTEDIFINVLNKFYNGEFDEKTIEILSN